MHSLDLYLKIIKGAQEIEDIKWHLDVNDYIIEKEELEKLNLDDGINTKNIAALDNENEFAFLIEPTDFTLRKLMKDVVKRESNNRFYEKVKETVDNGKFDKDDKDNSLKQIEKISYQEIKDKYYIFLSVNHVFNLLNEVSNLNEDRFFEMYNFIKFTKNKYNTLNEVGLADNIFTFNSLLILYFMNIKGYEFDFEKFEFGKINADSALAKEKMIL